VLGTLWAVAMLLQHRPRRLLVHNSFLLSLVCALFRACRGPWRTRLIVDCHNKSLKRSLGGPLKGIFWTLKQWTFKRFDAVLVSNQLVLPIATSLCQRAFVLRDPLPDAASWPDASPDVPRLHQPFVVFICTFEPDEPIEEILTGAQAIVEVLDHDVVITGDARHLPVHLRHKAGERVHLSGYLPTAQYRGLLARAAAVIDLTNDSDCLVCGGYEALALCRPLVLSDTPLLRSYFTTAAVYTRHDAPSLVAAVAQAAASRARSPEYQAGLEGLERGHKLEAAGLIKLWRAPLSLSDSGNPSRSSGEAP